MRFRLTAAALLLTTVAACVPRAEPPQAPAPLPAPTPAPAPAPTPTQAPAPAPPPFAGHWMDAPRSPGDWFYKQVGQFSYAVYGNSDTDFGFVMRCDPQARRISIGRVSAQQVQQPLTFRTESLTRTLTAVPRQGSIETLLAVDLASSDPLLDALAISKGRFAVEAGGEAALYIPSWPEVTRLIEDCR